MSSTEFQLYSRLWDPSDSCETFVEPSSSGWGLLLSMCTTVTCSAILTCDTQAYSIHAKRKPVIHFIVIWLQGTVHINKCVSLLCICLYIPYDGFRKKKPCIFCDKAVRHHQAIKNNTSHAYLYSTLNNISKYCLYRLITKSACGTQTDGTETC